MTSPSTPAAGRAGAIAAARSLLTEGDLLDLLAERVAHPTESQGGGDGPAAHAYLDAALRPELETLDFAVEVHENPVSANQPLLVARRIEDPALPTVLLYGHGDVQFAHAEEWSDGLDPWVLTRDGDRLYGRGSADNKGQHLVNHQALGAVLRSRGGRLGYNVTILVETAEESGSVGLREFCAAHRDGLLAADLFLGSDGPRLAADVPTLFLGSRGAVNFWLRQDARDGDHHSGNWGGKLRNPATTLAAAIHALVDGDGVIRIPALRPPEIPAAVREAIAALPDVREEGAPEIDPTWGEPGLTHQERTLGWNGLEVLALDAGNRDSPVNAIPGRAAALLQLRFVVGTDITDLGRKVEEHLAAHGIPGIEVDVPPVSAAATRLDPAASVVRAAVDSVTTTCGASPAVQPNLGGTIPNDAFSEILGLPTVWIPHSYPGCNQHAPDEHILVPILESGLEIMAGMFWDMAEQPDRWFTSQK
ncbi:M20 family metallopeptidase [Brevibacterium litoralis]|uniref:M20 family metallopeptidase n=1 Tax=Brevibacterium litoralis TaxID=3138935 RepID=UPI0032ECFC8B